MAENEDSRDDQELVAAANAGDMRAFESLYYRYRDWVVNLAFRFTSDRDLALDVLQETFLYFMQKFPGFKLTCHLKTFLYPAVRNLSITAQQKARRAQGDIAIDEQLPDMTSAATQSLDDVETVLQVLGPDHREVLLLRFVDGLTLAEIEEAMNIPLGTVKSRLHNALAILRKDERTRKLFGE